MSLELVAIVAAIVVVAITTLVEVLYLGDILHRIDGRLTAEAAALYEKMKADDARLYLQGKRIEEVMREMRAELLKDS